MTSGPAAAPLLAEVDAEPAVAPGLRARRPVRARDAAAAALMSLAAAGMLLSARGVADAGLGGHWLARLVPAVADLDYAALTAVGVGLATLATLLLLLALGVVTGRRRARPVAVWFCAGTAIASLLAGPVPTVALVAAAALMASSSRAPEAKHRKAR
jgi:hypothetical protein